MHAVKEWALSETLLCCSACVGVSKGILEGLVQADSYANDDGDDHHVGNDDINDDGDDHHVDNDDDDDNKSDIDDYDVDDHDESINI